ncbi:MAG: vWA domain-containing protein [Syntrophothermus sp.]
MFRIAHPYLLYLLALIPVFIVIFISYLIWRKKALNRYGHFHVIRQLMPEFSTARLVLKFGLLMLAYALLVIAVADPQTGSKLEKVHRKGIDIMVALDVSNSMLAEDIRPNRLERARQALSKLLDKLEGDRIGIVVFAGKAYTQLPITTDYAAAKMFLSTISTNSVPTQGTAIGEAIKMCETAFNQQERNKAIVIITDGEDQEGNVIEAADEAAKKGIAIYTIGMGLPDGAPIPVFKDNVRVGYKQDQSGNTIISKLNEIMLQQIASTGKGIYVRANNTESGLQQVLDDLGKIEKSEIETKQFSAYEDRFQYFIMAALFLLVLELFIFEKKNQWFNKFKPFENQNNNAVKKA